MNYKRGLLSALLMYLMANGHDFNQPHEPTLEELEPEYNLIKQKKSKLSRMQRDKVVFLYEKLKRRVKG